MRNFYDSLERLGKDTKRSSTEIFFTYENLTKKFLKSLRGKPKDDAFLLYRTYVVKMLYSRRDFAIVINFSNLLLRFWDEEDGELPKIIEKIHEFEKSLIKSDEKLRENALRELMDKKSFLVHSRSRTIELVLGSLENPRVFFTESYPGKEGVTLFNKLKKRICEATLIYDLEVPQYMKRVDAVLLGADALFEHGFVNKLGSFNLSIISEFFNVPVYVLATRWKFLNQTLEKLYKIESKLLEFVPKRGTHKIVTDLGKIDKAEDMRILGVKEVHPVVEALTSMAS